MGNNDKTRSGTSSESSFVRYQRGRWGLTGMGKTQLLTDLMSPMTPPRRSLPAPPNQRTRALREQVVDILDEFPGLSVIGLDEVRRLSQP